MELIDELIIKAKEGDKKAQDKLVLNNINLVRSIVRRITKTSIQKYDEKDLFQIGVIGLIKAIKKFEPERQVKFSTYAFPLILGEIKMFLREDGIIKISRTIKDNAKEITKLKERYIREGKGDITISQIEKELGLTKTEIILAINSKNEIGTIVETNEEEETNLQNLNIITNLKSQENVEEEVIKKTFLKEILKKLTNQEREVIVLRYIKEEKQNEIGKRLNITQVKVSRLEKNAIKKLKQIFA